MWWSAPWIAGIIGTDRSVRAIGIEKWSGGQFDDGATAGAGSGGRRRREWGNSNTLQRISVLSEKQSAISRRHSDPKRIKMNASSFRNSQTRNKDRLIVSHVIQLHQQIANHVPSKFFNIHTMAFRLKYNFHLYNFKHIGYGCYKDIY